VVATYTIKGGH